MQENDLGSEIQIIAKPFPNHFMKLFDHKLGKGFLDTIPPKPGVYRVYNADGCLIYIGKAKNLKRRLSQYRNAKRCKKHRKMKKIIEEVARIDVEVCSSEGEAILLETRLIQAHRPRWNVAGAFYFLYPMLGLRQEGSVTWFCYTTEPELFPDFEFFGAYRSRLITREAFFAWMSLLPYLGHRLKRSEVKRFQVPIPPKYSYLYGFRQISPAFLPEFLDNWRLFWKGESKKALETLVLALVENAGARQKPQEIQTHLNSLVRFWRHEVIPLAKARHFSQYPSYPVTQRDRDLIFLKYRLRDLPFES